MSKIGGLSPQNDSKSCENLVSIIGQSPEIGEPYLAPKSVGATDSCGALGKIKFGEHKGKSYRSLCARYSRSDIKIDEFILYISHLIVPFAPRKLLAFGYKNK